MATRNQPRPIKTNKRISTKKIRILFRYSPRTGNLYWAHSNRRAGFITTGGYRYISIDKEWYLEHRIIWALVTGEHPKNKIDHKNKTRADNRWSNLREATNYQNALNRKIQSNNKSGLKGVCKLANCNRWRAQIVVRGKHKCLGLYATKEEAYVAYCAGAKKWHGVWSSTT